MYIICQDEWFFIDQNLGTGFFNNSCILIRHLTTSKHDTQAKFHFK